MTRRDRCASLTLIVALVLFGCAVPLAPQDEKLGDAASALQVKVDAFFDELQRTAGTPEGGWQQHASFYEGVRAEIETIRAVSALRPRDAATRQAVELLAENFAALEAAHRKGIAAAEVPVLRKLIGAQLRALAGPQPKEGAS